MFNTYFAERRHEAIIANRKLVNILLVKHNFRETLVKLHLVTFTQDHRCVALLRNTADF